MNMPVLHAELAANPRLSNWIRVTADNTIELFIGKVELGQGAVTALAQMAALELGVPLASLRVTAGATESCPDQGLTVGSLSVQIGGMAVRGACAEVRQRFIAAAAQRFEVAPDAVCVAQGRFHCDARPGRELTYGELANAVDLDVPADGSAMLQPWTSRESGGTSAPRLDLSTKLFGAAFVHDLELPSMLHGRVVRPASYGARLVSFDVDAVRALPGVEHVLVDGNFIGICARREEQAVKAAKTAQRLACWQGEAGLPTPDPAQSWLPALPSESTTIEAVAPANTPLSAQIDVRYSKPFLAHASIGPACALAHWQAEAPEGAGPHLSVWSHTQGSFALRRELSYTFGLALEQISVTHKDGAGCYGHNGADDVALDAALLSRACGRPVRVQWSREDELSWASFGSAMVMRIDAGLDANGRIAHWRYGVWSHTHAVRPGTGNGSALLAAWHREQPGALPEPRDFPFAQGGGGQRNSQPLYKMAGRTIDYHFVPARTLRCSALRTLGAFGNVFAIESAMDELAVLADIDPIAFRLAHLEDPRAIAVLDTVARESGWHEAKPEAKREDAMRGRGVGFAQYKNGAAYCAVVIEIEVTDRILLERVTVAVDAGEVINPDGLLNQVEGGVLQAASWTLKEAVQWDHTGITSRTWDDYPILRFDEVPKEFAVHIVPHPELPPLGVGECAAGPTAAAIGNALADALGLRVRDLPLTPDRLMAAMQAA
jgi:CO/xanthine dehydrogenase Mo-binding subunit